ncbi:MarR family transcriptional regulator [Sulfitobacter albidus]|uniref:MarR family transcriptional regulator n=1 Tax=Sulfitobacter albidus TaxID=2829501 RepID=A0A975PPA5_9RHOB|nr:MarR family transcriptional regulator [Sulfitobacter albidus]QUJ78155.1 MarR family transcriptional regulator [Sulfitobacter albidus]
MNQSTQIDPLPDLADIGLEAFAPYLMNRIMGRYNAALQAEMTALGLTTPQMRALAVLSVVDGPLIRELAVYTVVQPSTLSRALDALEDAGLIRRDTDAADGRGLRVHLTRDGAAAFARLWPLMSGAEAQMFAGVPEAERAAFIATLQTILRNVRKHDF